MDDSTKLYVIGCLILLFTSIGLVTGNVSLSLGTLALSMPFLIAGYIGFSCNADQFGAVLYHVAMLFLMWGLIAFFALETSAVTYVCFFFAVMFVVIGYLCGGWDSPVGSLS